MRRVRHLDKILRLLRKRTKKYLLAGTLLNIRQSKEKTILIVIVISGVKKLTVCTLYILNKFMI